MPSPAFRPAMSLIGVSCLAACVATGYATAPVPPPRSMLARESLGSHVSVHEERHEIEIVVGPFHLAATHAGPEAGHGHEDEGMSSPLVVVRWPVDGGMAGFRMAAYESDGRLLPRDIVHHVIGVNFARRQLVYPVAERLFGFGAETPDIRLPASLEVPVARGDSVGVYVMWNNTTGRDLHGVYLQVVLPYAGDGRARERALPIYVDTNHRPGRSNAFDLPPGRSTRSSEFELPVGGGLLFATGHLHDHGVELRLEEVATGRVVTRLRPEVGAEGGVLAVEQRAYRRLFNLLDARLRLEAGTRYRVVGVYENPTGRTIPDGGMAHIVGAFVPDDLAAWPAIDPSDADYAFDLAALPRSIDDTHVHH